VETKILAELQSAAQSQGVEVLINAPDVFYMIAILKSSPMCNGQGDRTYFMNSVLQRDPASIKDLARKLMVLTQTFKGCDYKVFGDKFHKPSNVDIGQVRRKIVFRVWKHTRRTYDALTIDELVTAFPFA